ncbi:Putative short-chain dehydrogenase/reductase SDR, NAD(P)-binding domain superfamily [Septoria linicola]|uniref:Short-chain dehydrogenase/reductase SDR, NAD(P)-binding domain superfamily n=1 Tax=Septoria linicola TaxID=215465 RepID=A0A9Q9AHM2_9PEZI|nr:putative short-chain dehydrogenase/reductase SDR, NAD(P)-binding domain superfamily [Septoria linicola]USW49564.1 Putative short-chain dehydrogenase/reductase SDR, NAD(P)-binding domain superfamily [Septoria linicola]
MQKHGPVAEFPVQGKIVAITGGGSGIGFAFARLCHEHGAKVLIGDLSLVSQAKDFAASSDNIFFQKCDVTNWQDLHDLISASVERFGSVPDVYVPSAGVFEPSWSNFWDDNEENGYKLMRINVDHPIKFTRLAMRALAGAEKQGVVCLLASGAGIRGHYLASLYTASKHAVVGFAKSMGQADGEVGVKLVAVLPGIVQTPLWEDRDDDSAAWKVYLDLMKSALQPEDVAALMLKMTESPDYGGGTCVLTMTNGDEIVVEESFSKQAEKSGSAPKLEPDLKRIRDLLESERGKRWA